MDPSIETLFKVKDASGDTFKLDAITDSSGKTIYIGELLDWDQRPRTVGFTEANLFELYSVLKERFA